MCKLSLSLLLALVSLSHVAYAQTSSQPASGSAAQPAAAPATTEGPTSVTLVLGPQFFNRNDLGRGRARFEEFRDVPQGFAFEFARIAWAPTDRHLLFSATAVDVGQKDQRYFADLTKPGRFRAQAAFVQMRRFYSNGSRALWSGLGTANLTLDETFRQGAELAAGAPAAPFASQALQAYVTSALAGARPVNLDTGRKDFTGGLDFTLASGLTLNVTGDIGTRDGTKPLGFGTYIRRQSLAGVPNTGAGSFWRETIEARGNELVEPIDHRISEGTVTLTWSKRGHTVSGGWFGSAFRNDASALYFDNPFEATPGRASATAFTPASDQEPTAPLGNNNLRGLYARSAMQLWPDNDYRRLFANASVKLSPRSRVSASVARGTSKQNDAFLPYAENDQVVFSGPGEPVVYARNVALPQPSLNGEMTTTQADAKLTTKLGIVSPRLAFRYYDLADDRPSIQFPGYSSAGDSYFRRSISQTLNGQKALFNVIGGYTRKRLSAGAAVKLHAITLDGEYLRTTWDYDARQVDKTTDDAFRGTVRFLLAGANVNAFYLHANRDYEGGYDVGLETSGVRAYDVWSRDRNQVGADVDLPLSDDLTLAFGASYWKDEYPGAVQGFAYGYGLQDNKNGAFNAGLTWARASWSLAGWTGYDAYEWNSLQVTKTSQSADYNPINRWTRGSSEHVFWIGLEGSRAVSKALTARGDVNWQKFSGDWTTANLATPDVNSAVAYPYPDLSDSTLTLRTSLLWAVSRRISVEGRYWFEPFRLNDFTIDAMQPYMQGVFKETRSSATDIGDMNVSRFLFLDSRYSDYTAHVVSALVHVRF
jgi:hypothetical protein